MRLDAIGSRPSVAGDRAPQIQVEGLRRFLRVLNKLPKDLQNETRDASQEIAGKLVTAATNAAHTPLQQLAAKGLKAKRDRIPVVTVSGTLQGKHHKVRATEIFYGAEFGGQQRPTTQQFQPHLGKRGYFLYPTLRAQGSRYYDMWEDAIDKAFKQWEHRGGE